MAVEKLKLPRSSYAELARIIMGYAQHSGPATLDQISQVTGVERTVVSSNNAFLSAVGLIQGGKAKEATDPGRALASALEHGDQLPGEVARAWQCVVNASDFLAKAVAAVRIRKGMDEATLRAHIAYSAGEPKKGGAMTGAGAVDLAGIPDFRFCCLGRDGSFF